MILFKNNIFGCIFFAIAIFQISACSGNIEFQAKKVEPNPTSYIFHLPKRQLRDSVISFFAINKQLYNQHLQDIFTYVLRDKGEKDMKIQVVFNAETFGNRLFGKKHFQNANAEEDIYLQSLGRKWYSKIYFVKENPMEFQSAYIIRFKRIDENSTELSINAEQPTALYRKNGMSQSRPIIEETPVPATTIEEYCLIQFVAQSLGDTSLPAIKIP